MNFRSRAFLFSVGLMLIVLSSCKKEQEFLPPPPDTPPSIERIAPSQRSQADTAGSILKLSYQLSDNEQMKKWYITEYIDGHVSNTILEEPLAGTNTIRSFDYTIPATVPDLTIIRLVAYLEDTKNQIDSVEFYAIKDMTRDTTQPFRLLSYTDQRIYNKLSTTNRSAYNLLTRTNIVTQNQAKDIQEITDISGEFLAALRSPNNGQDSVFVVRTGATLNFDDITHTIMAETYAAGPHTQVTPTLQPGDVIVMKLFYQGKYAAIRIKEIVNTGTADNEDYIVFDYKRTE